MKKLLLIISMFVAMSVNAQNDTLVYVSVCPSGYTEIIQYNLVLITKDQNGEITIPSSYADKCEVIEGKGIVMEVYNSIHGKTRIAIDRFSLSLIKKWDKTSSFITTMGEAVENYSFNVEELKANKMVTWVHKKAAPRYTETNDIKLTCENENTVENKGFDPQMPFYDLSGRRVTYGYAGVVVQNGKHYIK